MVMVLLMEDILLFVKMFRVINVVQWGSDHDNSQWKQNAPNTSGRGFRHVCEELNNHSKQVIGIKNNAGYHYGWAISNNENLHEYNFGDKKFTDIPTGFGNPLQTIEVINTRCYC